MAENTSVEMKQTLGLTGLTMNAMALIAPGAFLWLTFFIQATTGVTAPAMWLGIVLALVLCLATAVCYAELAKLYPGTGSSYYFAEQSFLNHDKAWRYARLSKFIVGWASHLYYWIYPGVMVAVMGILCGYLVGTIWPNFMSASNPGIAFMMLVAIVFSFVVAYIAHRGVTGSTAVSIAINVIQIAALVLFAVLALGYRMNHPPGTIAYQFDSVSGEAYTYEFATTTTMVDGKATDTIVRDSAGVVPQPKLDAAGNPVPFKISYPETDSSGAFLSHPTAKSVVSAHNWGWVFIQATVAILILVGFESVTSMGGEARNAKRDIPIAVLVSLLVQGLLCYLFEYFAANYFLNSGYSMANASGSAAPIGDMMVVVGDALLGPGHGRTFMLCEAFTVFLALIGTTLSCMNTGARVTYAMGKDKEAPEHFGMLHSENLSPHRAIWTLAVISAVVACLCPYFRVRRCRCTDRCRDSGPAARLLVELRIHQSRSRSGHAKHAAHHDAGFQLRHVPVVRPQLRHLSRWLPQSSQVQAGAPPGGSALWTDRQPGLHGVLSHRTLHGVRHQERAFARSRGSRWFGSSTAASTSFVPANLLDEPRSSNGVE